MNHRTSIALVVSMFCSVVPAASRAASAPSAPAVALEAGLGTPVMLGGRRNTAFLRVSLLGSKTSVDAPRPEVNVCLAIDRSGSMMGEKMAAARRGAISALSRLSDRDLVSVVAYDDTVQIVVPATRASNRRAIEGGIGHLEAGGGTALFAGVVKCAQEVRKFATRDRVNRIILLSDGNANVGPASPTELGILGADLMREGISVATVGLGTDYNEDLMSELALRSDGRHAFVERSVDLARFLDEELGAATSVVARDAEVTIRCGAGSRPLRVLGRPADIAGQAVTASFGKIYAGRQHFFVVVLDVDPPKAGEAARPIADVKVAFRDLLRNQTRDQQLLVAAQFTDRPKEVDAHANPRITAELGLLSADAAAERALQLRDAGDIQGAAQVLSQSSLDLEAVARKSKDTRLQKKIVAQRLSAKQIQQPDMWKASRKLMKRQISDDVLDGI
ncbi:MAG TPA: VWA domain-containing protein [Polyangia bacterium]|jgi:Ca-activated chloride channel family protein|nr:VWA domain-containing protein [Polyangia bacterium]